MGSFCGDTLRKINVNFTMCDNMILVMVKLLPCYSHTHKFIKVTRKEECDTRGETSSAKLIVLAFNYQHKFNSLITDIKGC